MALPSGKESRIQSIDVFEGSIESANAPMSVTLRLEDEIDISRGDMLVHPDNRPSVSQHFEANLVWMTERALDKEKSYLIKHTSQVCRVNFDAVDGTLDFETLNYEKSDTLNLNDIGKVRLTAHRPLCFDPYRQNRRTGAFIIIDSLTNNTVAAGMITGLQTGQNTGDDADASGLSQVSRRERRELLGQGGGIVWISGDAATRQNLLYAVERALSDRSRATVAFDTALDALEALRAPTIARAAAEACASAALIALVASEAPLSSSPSASKLPALEVRCEAGSDSETTLHAPPGTSTEEHALKIVEWLSARGLF
jgi:hypothetical protein